MALLVTVLNFTPLISLTAREIVVFIISAVMLVIGMAFFNLGADIAMTPMGDHIGAGLTRSKKVEILIADVLLWVFSSPLPSRILRFSRLR